MNDEELLDHWQAGDLAAGKLLFNRHYEAITRFFSHKVPWKDVEDLTQQTFEGLFRKADTYRCESSVRTFLFGIAFHKVTDYVRGRCRSNAVADLWLTSSHDLNPRQDELVNAKREDQLLLAALRRIPLAQQTAIELQYWEEMSGKDIAAVLSIPEGTVRSRIREGIQRLRIELEQMAVSRELLNTTMASLDSWAKQIQQSLATLTPSEGSSAGGNQCQSH